jgi:hypothetical protein
LGRASYGLAQVAGYGPALFLKKKKTKNPKIFKNHFKKS